jgi:hypothetical protein
MFVRPSVFRVPVMYTNMLLVNLIIVYVLYYDVFLCIFCICLFLVVFLLACDCSLRCVIESVSKKLYSDNPNVPLWRVLRKRLHLKAYKLSFVRHLERRIICGPLKYKRFRKTRHRATFGRLL